jgi:hypothetical protein
LKPRVAAVRGYPRAAGQINPVLQRERFWLARLQGGCTSCVRRMRVRRDTADSLEF